MRYAACDIGTNSCRLLVAEIRESGKLEVLLKKVVTTRIGEGLQGTGRLGPAAISRTLSCLESFAETMRRYQVSKRVVVATNAVREAGNREEFLAVAAERTGMKIQVLSGKKEGRLSYLGARVGLGLSGNLVLADVGGGSSELIYQQRGIKLLSIPVGAVRAWEADWNQTEIRSRLVAELPTDLGEKLSPLVLVGGTATSLVAMKKGLMVYDPHQVQGEKISLLEISAFHDRLDKMSLEERKALPGLQPGRADIIVKGVLILESLVELLEREEALVSDSDLLDGLIWELHYS